MEDKFQTIVLVAGLGMRGKEFDTLSKHLEKKKIKSFMYDNLHVGEGPRPSRLSIRDQALYAWEKVDQVLGERSKIAIFGLSMGAMIAATMATVKPDRVSTLIMGATSPNTPDIQAFPDALYQSMSGSMSLDQLRDALLFAFGSTTMRDRRHVIDDYLKERLKTENLQAHESFILQLDSIRSFNGAEIFQKIHEIGIPSCLISGAEDNLFPKNHSEFIVKYVHQHIELAQTGHMLHIEAPEKTANILAKRVWNANDSRPSSNPKASAF